MKLLDVKDRNGGGDALISLDTEALVLRCQRGDRLAVETLILRYQNYVYRLCFLVMRNEQDAEDMTQETFIRAFRALPRFEVREGKNFEGWLYRIAVNACRSRMRRKWYQVLPWPEPAPTIAGEPEEQPDRLLMQGEARQEMLAAIDALGEKHRLVVILRYYAGLSNEEIAEVLSIPSGTVRSRLHMARKRLKKVLKERENKAERTVSRGVAA
ncbi:MAG TPA: sigma-70 family RNA polymerase sigma factor [Anaerolineae bacterium]|nr:sigma-70 family RNA polymerase sigma factor [Anaerolineae bacterium]